MPDWQAIHELLANAGLNTDPSARPSPVGGGDISAAWRVASADRELFLKTGPVSSLEMFAAECEALQEIAQSGTVRVPLAWLAETVGNDAVLVLEWLTLEPARAEHNRALGTQLASMHRVTGERFGWHRDNFIGLTPQPNRWSDDWVAFFREQRLGHQLKLAKQNGFGGPLQAEGGWLAANLSGLFEGYEPAPSLLHGDLWGGNWAVSDGVPVIYDPATYYGDRETDIAMTMLFGGFGREFYAAYGEAWPMADGHEARLELYQLYHVLNHLNLFGAGYLGRAESLIASLLRRLQ